MMALKHEGGVFWKTFSSWRVYLEHVSNCLRSWNAPVSYWPMLELNSTSNPADSFTSNAHAISSADIECAKKISSIHVRFIRPILKAIIHTAQKQKGITQWDGGIDDAGI